MKPRFTLALVLVSFSTFLSAQVKFKVKLLSDNTTYQVLMRPDVSYSVPFNTVPSAQVTLLVPTGGFNVGTVTGLAGSWTHNATVTAPPENPNYQYMVFALQGATTMSFSAGVEVPMFNFTRTGACTGVVALMDNATDPFFPPNSQSVNAGNQISVVGAGIGVNAYTGNYGNFDADCTTAPGGCGIEVFDVAMTSPSACGVADGMITITATNSGALPLQYSIDDGVSWQTGNTFTGLTAGQFYYLWVRDIASICIVEIGEFVMEGPLAAAVTGVDLVDPSCGGSDGSITIHAFSENGGTLQYAMSASGPWQFSSTFPGLAAGTYSFWVQDIVNNCSNFIGSFALQDCQAEPCIISYQLENLGNGLFQVNMLTDVTYNFPDNITSSLQVTLKVPTGGFTLSNLTSQTTGVTWGVNSTYVAPSEAPGFDYVSIGLTSFGTTNIPYVDGNVVNLFSFQNTGSCEGDSIYLMQNDDPFFPPNSLNANVGQQLTVAGYGGADVPVCLPGTGAVACDVVPPVVPTCVVTYVLEEIAGGAFQVSMISDTTWTVPFNTVSSMQFSVKVPAGGFVPANLTSLISGVNFSVASTYDAPAEDPAHDYISFVLNSPGTTAITFVKNQKVPLFTFTNSGTCAGGSVFLMDNDTDPFFPPNSLNANVGQQLTVLGFGGADATICIQNLAADDCSPCGTITAGEDKIICPGASALIELGTVTGTISWSPTTGLSCSNCASPTASPSVTTTYTVTVTDGGCVMTDELTVFVSAGATPGFTAADGCEGVAIAFTNTTTSSDPSLSWNWDFGDNTATSSQQNPAHTFSNSGNFEVSLTVTTGGGCTATFSDFVTVFPTPGELPQDNYSICNGEGVTLQTPAGLTSASWSPSAGLDNASSLTPMATPSVTTTYAVTMTNANGCTSQDQATVTVAIKPLIQNVAVTNPPNCDPAGFGSITVTATGTGALEYSINNGQTWQASNVFNNVAAGSNYVVLVRLATGVCPVAWNDNPVSVGGGSLLTILTPVNDFTLCDGFTAQVSIAVSEDIQSQLITGQGGVSFLTITDNVLQFTVSAPGDFHVNITGVGGCTVTEDFIVNGVPLPVASFTSSTPACTGGEVTLNFTGQALQQAALNWSLSGGQVVFSSPAGAGLPAGATTVVRWNTPGVKNVSLNVSQSGCADIAAGTVTVTNFDPGVNFDVTEVSTCGANNGAINLILGSAGNFQYNWSGAGVSTPTAQDLSNLPGGSYSVTITENSSECSIVSSVQVPAPQPVNITGVTGNPSSDCTGNVADGSVQVTASGGEAPYIFNLYAAGNPNTPIATLMSNTTTATFQNVAVGAFSVEVIDDNDCSDLTSATVAAGGSDLQATIGSLENADCGQENGSFSLNVSGGQSPYNYEIFLEGAAAGSGNVTGNALMLNNLEPGNYAILIFDDNGCLVPQAAFIDIEPADFGVTETVTQPSCGSNDGGISLANLPQGATLAWQAPGGSLPPSPTQTGLAAGAYVVTISTANGCSQALTYVLTPANAAEIAVDSVVSAACTGANGGAVFVVTGGNSFSYSILNSSLTGFGSPGTPVVVTGLAAGAYVVEIDDLLADCNSLAAFVVPGTTTPISTLATITPPSACGVEDASICIQISGGTAPYDVASNLGIAPNVPVPSEGCVQSLYEGQVILTVTDANGCSVTHEVSLDEIAEPTLNQGDVTVTGNVCPDVFIGSIVANDTALHLLVFDENNFMVGITPLTQVPGGNFTVVNSDGNCSAEIEVTVQAPPDWNVSPQAQAATCLGNDGSVSLNVSGANGGYTYVWSTTDTTSSISDQPGNTIVSVTITDSEGCTWTDDALTVPDDCDCDETLFSVEYFNVLLTGTEIEVCLPTNTPDLTVFDLELDENEYAGSIDSCVTTSIFYGLGGLMDLGQPPFNLEEWTYRGSKIEDFAFATVEQLVNKMNDLDPTGNWASDASETSVIGGVPGTSYGSLVITHLASSTTLTLQVNTLAVTHPSIFVSNEPVHIFIAIDPEDGCADTLYINVLEPPAPDGDTLVVVISVGSDSVVCLPVDELFGTPEFLTSLCPSFTGNAQVLSTDTTCVEIVGIEVGEDQACIEICDNLGFCDTTWILIEVVDTSTAIEIFNGLSPNEDGFNDFFKIKNIELYPDNELQIFNRWGNSVYHAKGYVNANPWKGIYKNTWLPDETYFYVLDVKIRGRWVKYSGFVELRK